MKISAKRSGVNCSCTSPICRTAQSLHDGLLNHSGQNEGPVCASLSKIVTDSVNENDFSGIASFWGVFSASCAETSLQLWGTRSQSRWTPALARHDAFCKVDRPLRKGNGAAPTVTRQPKSLCYPRIYSYYYCTLCQHPATGSPSGPCKSEGTDLISADSD